MPVRLARFPAALRLQHQQHRSGLGRGSCRARAGQYGAGRHPAQRQRKGQRSGAIPRLLRRNRMQRATAQAEFGAADRMEPGRPAGWQAVCSLKPRHHPAQDLQVGNRVCGRQNGIVADGGLRQREGIRDHQDHFVLFMFL
jgi:hypothetical protein